MNLSKPPADQQAAVKQDKSEWYEAWKMVRTMTAEKIKLWLHR